MLDAVIEVSTNLFQAFMFVGFLYLFFEKSENRTKNTVSFIAFVAMQFLSFNYFSFFGSYEMDYLNTLSSLVILELYSIAFLKGHITVRIVMPVLSFVINTTIAYTFAYFVSFFSEVTYGELATQMSVYRLLCIVVINITTVVCYLIMLKIKARRMQLLKAADLIAFVVIPIFSLVIVYSTFGIILLTRFQTDIVPFLVTICASMIVVSVMIWLMMTRISKDHEIKTQLLLMQQREEMYRNDVLKTSNQIREVSRIKHDMKNNLLCIDGLISDEEYKQAQNLCTELSQKMDRIYTPVTTENPLLNAVVNVELEKALSLDIDFVVQINSSLSGFSDNSDIVSIIGNLCDNAIDYLQKCEKSSRKMKLEITKHNDYYIIICSNKIAQSVLFSNPELKTSKADKETHGKGIEILKSIVAKYNGELKYYEKDGYFYAAAVLRLLTTPENR